MTPECRLRGGQMPRYLVEFCEGLARTEL
jgi:hypothetical protein